MQKVKRLEEIKKNIDQLNKKYNSCQDERKKKRINKLLELEYAKSYFYSD